MSDENRQTGQSAIIDLPDVDSVMSLFVAPVVVAVVVGAGASYLTAQNVLTRIDERQQHQAQAIESVKTDVDDLSDMTGEVDRLTWQIDRLEEKIDEVD